MGPCHKDPLAFVQKVLHALIIQSNRLLRVFFGGEELHLASRGPGRRVVARFEVEAVVLSSAVHFLCKFGLLDFWSDWV